MATGNSASPPKAPAASISQHIEDNIAGLVALQRREWEQTSASQRRVERISRFIGRPAYLVGILVFAAVWILGDMEASTLGWTPLDQPPFPVLQGLLTLVALITTTIVLIAQNRQTKLEQQHAHLDLQVNLLTEQKVTKIIHLMEELRRDLPMVRDRHDPQASALQEPTNTAQVLTAIEEGGLTGDEIPGVPKG